MKPEMKMGKRANTKLGYQILLVPMACLAFFAGSITASAQDTAATIDVAPVSEQVVAAPVGDVAAPTPPEQAAAATPADALLFDDTALLATADAKSHVRDGSLQPESLATLFFTAWQHALLQEAKLGFNTSIAASGTGGPNDEQAKRDPGIREVSLGGIAFSDTKKWTVWLNGVRVTPLAIPAQVLDIKVSRAYIDLKWFDGYTNKIYPIRLRPQERFNLDSRIFLPGTNESAL